MSALPIGRNWSKQDHALDTCKTRASKQGSQNSQRGYYDTWTKQRQILERWRHFQTYNSKVILQFCFFFCYYFLFRIISNMKRNTERLFVKFSLSFQVNSVLCTSCFGCFQTRFYKHVQSKYESNFLFGKVSVRHPTFCMHFLVSGKISRYNR